MPSKSLRRVVPGVWLVDAFVSRKATLMHVLGTWCIVLAAMLGVAPSAVALDKSGALVNAAECMQTDLPAADDLSSQQVRLATPVNFYGRTENYLWVNNNGNITFDGPQGAWVPYPIRTANRPIIAPFFADVDTGYPASSVARYGFGETVFEGHPAFCANWVDVGYYDRSGTPGAGTDKFNSFQLLLVDRSDVSTGDFDIVFNYGSLLWEAGYASAFPPSPENPNPQGAVLGLGGISARAGFANGDGTPANSFEIAGSAINGAFLDSNPNGLIYRAVGSDQKGRQVFRVRNGRPATNVPPVANAGAAVNVVEGDVGRLDASGSTDADNDPLAYAWKRTDSAGASVVLSSLAVAKPTFDAVDDGTASFALTVDDSKGGAATDSVKVRTSNAPPVIAASDLSGVAGGASVVSGTFTDPGVLDKHTATVDWGDGSAVEAASVTDGTGWGTFLAAHRFASAGSYDVVVKVRDDDGGEDTRRLKATITAATGIWSTSRASGVGIDITGAGTKVDGLLHSDSAISLLGLGHSFKGGVQYATSLFGITLGSSFSPAPVKTPARPAPVKGNIADFRPGGRVAREAGTRYFDYTAHCATYGVVVLPAGPLPTGAYYAPCPIKILGAAVRGEITVASEKQIILGAAGAKLRSFTDGILAISAWNGPDAILTSSAGADLTGYLLATGDIRISGTFNVFRCGLQADEISIIGASNAFTAADCSRPTGASSTINLVPTPKLGVSVDRAAVTPGDQLQYGATLTNDGATFVVSGVIGAAGVGSPAAKVASYALAVEYFSAAQQKWIPLTAASATAAGFTPTEAAPTAPAPALVTRAMTSTGVTPAAGGAIVGTQIADGATAAWGYQLRLNLTPEQVRLLTDPARTTAIRTVSHLESSTSTLRELFRTGDDFIAKLRSASAGGALENGSITLARPDGTQRRFDRDSVAALASVAPGSTVSVTDDWIFPAPAARGPLEPSAAYVARLKRTEAAGLRGVARAQARSGAIRMPLEQAVATSSARLPILSLQKSGPAALRAGDQGTYKLAIRNTGSAAAEQVLASDEVVGQGPVPVAGVPAQLAPAASATGIATYTTPSSQTATIRDTGSVRWRDARGNQYGPIDDSFATTISTPAALQVTLEGRLTDDADNNDEYSPGDEISYEAVVRNEGTEPLNSVLARIPLDANLRVSAGSVVTSEGSITDDGSGGSITATIPTLAGPRTASIRFRARIVDPLPAGVRDVRMQARVTSATLPDVLSDNPFTAERGDVTVHAISRLAPRLTSELSAVVQTDADADNQPSPGDTLRYTLKVVNSGDASATGLQLTVPAAEGLTLVAGSVSVIGGASASTNAEVRASAATLTAGATLRVSFDQKVAAQLPRDVDRVQMQGTIATNEITASLTDDPTTAADFDATVTPLTIAPRLIADQTAQLLNDVDGNGVVSPGDRLRYSVRILNDSNGAATGVEYRSTFDANVLPVAGSATATQGTIAFAAPGVVANLGSIAGNAEARITYDVDLKPIITGTYQAVSGQGTIAADGRPTTRTDDPNATGGGDATVTPVVATTGAAPRLVVRKRDRLAVDADGDGEPSPGDTLSYEINISNPGAGPATAVVLTDNPGDNTTLVSGSVQNSTGGTIDTGNETAATNVKVLLDRIAAASSSTTTFQVKVADTIPAGVDRVANRAKVASAELGDVLSVDPDVAGSTSTETLLALPPLPAPSISNISPAEGAVVKTLASVTANIEAPIGQSIERTCVRLREVASDVRRTLHCSTSPPTAVLGSLDPTLLKNGVYVVYVEALASGGGTSEESVTVSVTGTAKLGRFNLSYRDITSTVEGIPVTVARTYDSFDKTATANSGIGWAIGVEAMKVQVPRVLGSGGWTWRSSGCTTLLGQAICLGREFEDLSQHRVSLTWPGGKVDSWDFTPTAGSGGIYYDASAAFTPRRGTTAKLTVVGDRGLQYWGDGNLYDADGEELFDPKAFVVTTLDGRTYEIDTEHGLTRLTTPQGTGFSIDEDGVVAGDKRPIRFSRDARDRITQVDVDGQTPVRYEYSSSGELVRTLQVDEKVTNYAYDDAHNLTNVAGPNGPERTMEYDSDGRLVATIDAAGNRTRLDISVGARTQATTNPRGTLTTVQSFDTDGNLTKVTEVAEGKTRETLYRYDARGNRTTTVDPLGRTTATEYDTNDLPTRVTLANGSSFAITRDSAGRPVEYTGPGGRLLRRLTLDTAGNPLVVATGAGRELRTEYDARGLPTTVTDATGQTVRYGYDQDGNLTSVSDAAGTTRFELDVAGRPTRTTDPVGATVLQSYTPAGQLATETDSRGLRTTYVYDRVGQLIRSTRGERVSEYSYDAVGRLATVRDGNNELRRYTYDADGQLIGVDGPGQDDLAHRYDGFGRLVEATNRSATIEFGSDAGGQVTSLATTALGSTDRLTYAYDAAGRMASQTAPWGTTAYRYNQEGDLDRIVDPVDGGFFGLTYDGVGRLSKLSRPNGVATEIVWDSADRVLGMTSRGPPGNVLSTQGYEYGQDGFPSAVSDASGRRLLTHDAAGRLTRAGTEAYTFDRGGNRLNGGAQYDEQGLLVTDERARYTYDGQGRLVLRTNIATSKSTAYTWNVYGQLVSVRSEAGETVSYQYDPLGRRLSRTKNGQTVRTTYGLGDQELARTTNGGTRTVTLSAPGLDRILAVHRGTTTSFPIQDKLGNVTTVTNGAGAVVERASYDAWGQPVGARLATIPYGYEGHEWDADALAYDFRARMYDSASGRFLSEDQIPSANPYAWVDNSPYRFTDPTGEMGIGGSDNIAAVPVAAELSTIPAANGGAMYVYGIIRVRAGIQELYVGITKNLVQRLSTHGVVRAGSSNEAMVVMRLQGDRQLARYIEQRVFDQIGLLKNGGPLGNTINSVVKNFAQIERDVAQKFLKDGGEKALKEFIDLIV